MPSFNTWAPRTGMWGNQLQVYHHGKRQGSATHWARNAENAGRMAQGVGNVVGFAIGEGARRFGQWYYPSEKINVSTRSRGRYRPRTYTKTVTKKKKKKKKVCCRRIRGKTYCSPEFCEKRRKKYWY